MATTTMGSVLRDILAPRGDGVGGFEFQPMLHEAHLARSEPYAAWWAGLADLDRARLQAELDRMDAREKAQRERDAARDRRRAEQDQKLARVAPFLRMQRRGVPAKDHEAIAGGALEETQALAAARELLAGELRILVLSGPKGCGKTTAAGWLVAQENVPRPPSYGDEPVYRPEPRFLDVSKLARLSRYDAEQIEPYETCTLLAIDDLGMEYADEKGSFLATLDGIFNARYAAGLFTVITTNLPAKAFKERYGERIADRIREVGEFLELNGRSMRARRSEP